MDIFPNISDKFIKESTVFLLIHKDVSLALYHLVVNSQFLLYLPIVPLAFGLRKKKGFFFVIRFLDE